MELAFWNVVVELGHAAGLPGLSRPLPERASSANARAGIAAIEGRRSMPTARPGGGGGAGAEPDDRRDIQRNLSLLGYNPRGIDGIFGPGSRAAITAWQRANGYRGDRLPDRRTRCARCDSAAEATRRRARRRGGERARPSRNGSTRSYWRDTGRGGSEAGLRAYLDRYPDGLFADIAKARLAEIEAAKRSRGRGRRAGVLGRRARAAGYRGGLPALPRPLPRRAVRRERQGADRPS